MGIAVLIQNDEMLIFKCSLSLCHVILALSCSSFYMYEFAAGKYKQYIFLTKDSVKIMMLLSTESLIITCIAEKMLQFLPNALFTE